MQNCPNRSVPEIRRARERKRERGRGKGGEEREGKREKERERRGRERGEEERERERGGGREEGEEREREKGGGERDRQTETDKQKQTGRRAHWYMHGISSTEKQMNGHRPSKYCRDMADSAVGVLTIWWESGLTNIFIRGQKQ